MYKPVFRQPEEEIEKSLEQKLTQRAKDIEERTRTDVQAAADAASKATMKQWEEREAQRVKEAKERDEQRIQYEQRVKEEVEKRAQKLTEEAITKLAKEAEEKAAKLAKEADEKTAKLAKEAEEKAAKLVDEKTAKLAKEAEEKAAKLAKEAEEKAAKLVKEAEEKAAKLAEEKVKILTEEQKAEAAKKLVEEQKAEAAKKLVEEQKAEAAKTAQTIEPKAPEASSKIARMIEEIKKRKATTSEVPQQSTQPVTSTIPAPAIPLVSPDQAIDDKDIINCPTCHSGHVHVLEPDGITYKCTGPECGKEYVMVDKTADYRCAGCGAPIKKPVSEKLKIDSCPFCHGKKAVKFDWNKLWGLKPSMKQQAK